MLYFYLILYSVVCCFFSITGYFLLKNMTFHLGVGPVPGVVTSLVLPGITLETVDTVPG